MGEAKAGIFSMAVFVLLIFPVLIIVGIESLHNHSFMKHTTELTEIVKSEGGVTPRVQGVVYQMKSKGYTSITFTDGSGSPLSGTAEYGDTITIEFEYRYDNPMKIWMEKPDGSIPEGDDAPKRILRTTNNVFVMRR